MNKKIWIVSELYYPEETSTGHFLTRLAEGLAKDEEVGVLCSQPTYSERGVVAPWQEIRNCVSVLRCWGTRLNKNILFFRLLNFLTISLSLFWGGLRRFKAGEKVLVVTNPPLLPFLIVMACRFKRAKPILLVHDVYPEVLVAAGITHKDSWPYRLVYRCTRWLYRQVALVVVLGRDMELLAAGKCDIGKIQIIPNWADLDEVVPDPNRFENMLLKECKLRDSFVVQYCGNMGRTHGLEYLIDAAVKTDLSVHFLLIGSGARKGWVEKEIPARGLENITLISRCPRNKLSEYLNACDLAVISFVPGMSGVSVPSRMYNIMAAGKPILAIADKNSELALVVNEERIGWVVAPGDIDGVVRAVDEAKANHSLRLEMGNRARKVAEEKYSLPRVIEMYKKLFAAL